jgi:hypothetical protein
MGAREVRLGKRAPQLTDNDVGLVCENPDRSSTRAFDKAGNTSNLGVRSANYSAVQREVNRRAYFIPLYFQPYIWTSDHHVLNVTLIAGGSGVPWDMYAWKVRGP